MKSWRAYGRCDECGAEPKAACRTVDDDVADEVCTGRPTIKPPKHDPHAASCICRECTPVGPRAVRRMPVGEAPVGLVAFNAVRALDDIARLVERPVDGLREHAEILDAVRAIVATRRKP